MVYITGDIHADQRKWIEQIDPCLKQDDIIIVAGNFGIGFWNGQYFSEETFYDWIEAKPYMVLVVDGNHENFDKLGKYPVCDWHCGKVHRIRKNLLHLMRGEIYESIVGEKSLFAFGGGYSFDKARRVEGKSWWPQEMPSEEEYKNAEDNIEKHHRVVDFVVTHTCPIETIQYLSSVTRGQVKNSLKEFHLNAFWGSLCTTVKYDRWYFGHFHLDREMWKNQVVIFNCIRELETGKIVKTWQTYESF